VTPVRETAPVWNIPPHVASSEANLECLLLSLKDSLSHLPSIARQGELALVKYSVWASIAIDRALRDAAAQGE
jgi:hypothetical protein